MKNIKKTISVFLVIAIVFCFSFSAFAVEENNNDISDARLIACNTPSIFDYSGEWTITQETTLYDCFNEVTGYCFDMVDAGSGITAYTIVNADKTDFPILLFGVEGVSAYYRQKFDRAYYFGPLDYYLQVDNKMAHAQTGESLTDEDLLLLQNSSIETQMAIAEDYFDTWQFYLNGNGQASTYSATRAADTNTVSNSVNLQWRKGCAPTSVAMMILTHLKVLDSTAVIDSLAAYMGTSSNGATDRSNIPSGTKSYCEASSLLTTPSVCKWSSTNSSGYPNTGLSYNSTATLKSNIDAGYPIGVYCSSSNVTTSNYPNGFGAHMMCGVGYFLGGTGIGNYVICYTTHTGDGKVSFPITSSGLKNHAWFLLRW